MHASLVEILYYLRTAGPLTLVHSLFHLYREKDQVLRSTLTHNKGEEIKLQKHREDSEAAQTALRFSSVLQALSFSWVDMHQPSEMVHLESLIVGGKTDLQRLWENQTPKE